MSRLLRTLVVLTLAAALLGPTGADAQAATRNPQSSPAWRSCTKTLDGVTTKVGRRQRSVTIVNQTSRTYARVSFWVRTASRCSFTRKFLTTSGRIGYNGTVKGTKRKQSTGTTPRGTYTMTEAFGTGPEPAMWLPYHRIVKGDYWVGDTRSAHYNSLRNSAAGGFRWKLPSSNINASENLKAFGRQYRYVVVINFNRAPDRRKAYRGFGIFLHVAGSGATAGCVGITAAQMRTVLAYLKPGDKITIAR